MELKSGSFLQGGRYRVEKTLGQGGFGITYLGTQIYLGRKVAIKEFFMDGFCMRDTSSYVTAPTDVNKGLVESFRRKFIKEAQNIAKLKHPNIVSIIDVFEDNGTAYYVMESLDGGSLADKVADGPLSEENALKYVRQVASALEYIHSNNMMHLDIKPANILLDSNDNAVVIDFGLAKQYDNTGQQTSTTPVGISHGYAPIEQYSKNGVGTFSPSTDIYSLGATLYKLVTGATPPEANHIYDEGLPPLPSYITPATCNAIEKAMQPRRKDRPQSVQEFLAILQGDVVPAVAAVSEHEAATFVPVEKTVSVQPQAGAGRSSDIESLVHSEPSLSPNSNIANGEKKKKGSLLWLWILLPSVIVVVLLGGAIWYSFSGDDVKEDTETVNNKRSVKEPVIIKLDSNFKFKAGNPVFTIKKNNDDVYELEYKISAKEDTIIMLEGVEDLSCMVYAKENFDVDSTDEVTTFKFSKNFKGNSFIIKFDAEDVNIAYFFNVSGAPEYVPDSDTSNSGAKIPEREETPASAPVSDSEGVAKVFKVIIGDEAAEKPAAKPAAKKSSGMKLVPVTSEPKKGDTPASGKKSSPRTQKVLHIKSNQSYTIE
ncbi:MAG: protein kinase [Bacteroidales bacterium]|nr:protein kinase [Bacteroidales bacterium]